MLVSYANIITRDAFLQSLLSCLSQWLFTSKSVSRHQPKRFFSHEYHCWSSTRNAVSHILFVTWLGPSHQQDDIHWVPMRLQYRMPLATCVRTPFVRMKTNARIYCLLHSHHCKTVVSLFSKHRIKFFQNTESNSFRTTKIYCYSFTSEHIEATKYLQLKDNNYLSLITLI